MSLFRVTDDYLGRSVWLAEVETLREWPAKVPQELGYFVLFLALDGRGVDTDEVYRFARLAIGQGLVYLCAWGDECERVHDIFDEVPEIFDPSKEGSLVMTTWHDGESLESALWFALNSALPDDDYEEGFRSIVALSVAQPNWAEEIRNAFRDRDAFERRTLDEDEELATIAQNLAQPFTVRFMTRIKTRLRLRR